MKRPPLYELLERVRFRQLFTRLYQVELHGAERIPAAGPLILVSNHESLIDPWFLGLATPRPIRYMAKAELWQYPVVHWVMEKFGTFPIERAPSATNACRSARAKPAAHAAVARRAPNNGQDWRDATTRRSSSRGPS